jgi:hypothetical protein
MNVEFLVKSTILIIGIVLHALISFSDDTTKDFLLHKKNSELFTQNRQKGLSTYLDEKNNESQEKEKDRKEYVKTKKWKLQTEPADREKTPEYYFDLKRKLEYQEDLQNEKNQYLVELKKKQNQILKTQNELDQKLDEFDLKNDRDRYDIKTRGLYTKRFMGPGSASGSSSGASSGSSYGGGSGGYAPPNSSPPPPPAVPDYYEPVDPNINAPNAPMFEDSLEEAPPPPPMMFDE